MASSSIKKLSESLNLTSNIPSNYVHYYFENPTETTAADDLQDSIPIIDISLLTSDDPDQRSKAIQDLDKACQEWGFFMAVNHGIPEELMQKMIEISEEFFNLGEEDKPEFEPKNVLEPVRYGTSFNTAQEEVHCWRDFLKVFVHPHFHSPQKPQAFRDALLEYRAKMRELVGKLVKGMSQGLGLEDGEMEAALDMGSSLQIFIANLYPPCPQPELALGLPPHSDHGLFTLLVENGVCGLQIEHHGKWVHVNAVPGSILVNISDHLEIFSNGKYKSVSHKAVVNDGRTRISIAMVNGPSLDTEVCPCPKLVQKDIGGAIPAYVPMKYKEYLLYKQSNRLDGKDILTQVK
ncbi:2-oxoglutarate-dependent dioxygenase 19-like [Henckelia pumila]|uniref:2-oxoglutarate-dependent dioxygenase 19-like n=1 Tax=Henckelia pumila TaxID=405737 RepID=UPI003C6DC71F